MSFVVRAEKLYQGVESRVAVMLHKPALPPITSYYM